MIEHQLVRYSLVGIFSISVDYFVLNILYLGLHFTLFWSVLLGFTTSVIVGYILHSRWTFRYNTSGREFSKITHYLFVTFIALGITESIVHLATISFGIHYNISKAVALFFAILFTYFSSKYWVFCKPNTQPKIL